MENNNLISILIDNPDNIHIAGNIITGKLCIKFSPTIDYGVSINLIGKLQGVNNDNKTEEIIFMNICGNISNEVNLSEGSILDNDVHYINFNIKLPIKLVSSLSFTNLSINYSLIAELKTDDEQLYSTILHIKVRDKYLLGDLTNVSSPRTVFNANRNPGIFQCLFSFCRRMPPKLSCTIPTRGVFPYDDVCIKINVNITSHCCVPPIKSVRVFLIQEVRWKQIFIRSFPTATKIFGDDLINTNFYESGLTITIPNIPPTGNYPNLELDITYHFFVMIKIWGRRSKIHINIPITIGSCSENNPIDINEPQLELDINNCFVSNINNAINNSNRNIYNLRKYLSSTL